MTERDQTPEGLRHNRRASDTEMSEIVGNLLSFMQSHSETQDRILRRDLFWRNARTGLFALALIAGPVIYSIGLKQLLEPAKLDESYVAMVRIEGEIGPDKRANAAKVNDALEKAFEDKEAKGVLLRVNSPGGTPVQSALIHDRILALRKKYPKKKVIAVGEDIVASGAYFVASAAESLYVNRSTQAGSIGVIMSSWGLDKVADGFHVERRRFTAGEKKARFDMFEPLTQSDKEKVEYMLQNIHAHFIDAVREGRGDRLKGEDKVLFSGDIWTGTDAVSLGLADGLSDVPRVLDEQFHVSTTKDYTATPSVLDSLSRSFGVMVEQWLSTGTQSQPMWIAQ